MPPENRIVAAARSLSCWSLVARISEEKYQVRVRLPSGSGVSGPRLIAAAQVAKQSFDSTTHQLADALVAATRS
jgi:hypothetical protein